MVCQFCKQEVDNPCRNAQQMQERATSLVERCEKALRSNASSGAHARDVQGGGKH